MNIHPKLKNVFIVWISIYPTITLILFLIGNGLESVPVYVKTLVLTLILVPLMVFVLIPFWTKVLNALGKRVTSKGDIVDK